MNLRVIASTNRYLRSLIQQGQFRQDLYFRLNRFGLHIPPLRQRTDDIPPLLDFFATNAARDMKRDALPVAKSVRNRLVKYAFPGNIRELRNMIEKAYILAGSNAMELDEQCFPDRFHFVTPHYPTSDGLNLQRLEEIEKQMIRKALEKVAGNKTRAAELLGITRTSLNRRIAKYTIK